MLKKALISLAFLACTITLGYFTDRSNFIILIGWVALFFLAYVAALSSTAHRNDIRFYVFLGILSRAVLLFNFPNLSDDIYRFYWDGLLSTNGYNPFSHLPDFYIKNNILPEYLTPALYEKLNSKEYYTIYPPVLQGIFAVAAWLFPKDIIGAATTMKFFLLMGEIGSITFMKKILQKLELSEENVLWYALNPLLIIEIIGNIHFEGFMIFFLLLSLWLMMNNRLGYAALAMAAAIASKLLPLMFLPFLIGKLGWRRSLIYFGVVGGILFILFVPLLNASFFSNFSASLSLYFRRFEFNAGFFYAIEWFYRVVFNDHYIIRSVGPTLALITLNCIVILTIIRHDWAWKKMPESWLFAISIYLVNTTTVHPWYICLAVALAVFTKWRYPIIWSGIVMLSYSHYWGGGFQENYLLIAIEYVIAILFFTWEFWQGLSRKMASRC